MPRRCSHVPDEVPEGTKYVVEVAPRPGFVHHYIEFPDGRRIDLGFRRMAPSSAKLRSSHDRNRHRSRKGQTAVQGRRAA